MPTNVSGYSTHEELDSSSTQSGVAAEDGTEDDLQVLDLLLVFAERKHIVIWSTAVFAFVALLIALILPKHYVATSSILPPQQNNSSLSSALASQLGGMNSLVGNGLGIKNANDTYVAMLKSNSVEDTVIRRFNLMDLYKTKLLSDARERLEKHTDIDGSGKDNLIRISIQDRNANRAAEIANGYVEEYQKFSMRLAVTEASQRRQFFEQQVKLAKDNLSDAEVALRDAEQTTGLLHPDSQTKALIESAATLQAQIVAKEVQIEGLRTYATSENPALILAEHELSQLREQMVKLSGNGGGLDDTFVISKGKVPGVQIEYLRKLRDVKYNETIFEILARQYETAKLDEAKQGSVFQVVDRASVPDKAAPQNRAGIVLGSTVAGFVIGVILAFLSFRLQEVKNDPEFAQKYQLLRNALRRSGATKSRVSAVESGT